MKKSTQLLFCSDIYGVTAAKVTAYQQRFGSNISFVSPYIGISSDGLDPSYELFTEQVGIDKYSQLVADAIAQMKQQPFIAIGESVGATALWCNTPILDPQQCLGAICLYGSRIREHLDIQPKCNTQLLFSQDEDYFVTDKVKAELNQRNRVDCELSPLPHGYASPGHQHFDPTAFERVIEVAIVAGIIHPAH